MRGCFSICPSLLCLLLLIAADDDALARARRICQSAGVEVIEVHGLPVDWPAAYDLIANRVLLNLDGRYWRFPAATQIYGHAIGLYSTASCDHIIRHEIGHARLVARVGVAKGLWMQTSPVGLPRDRIVRTVSSCAAENQLEFVAEVYCGLWAGKVYPDDVMRCYRGMWRDLE